MRKEKELSAPSLLGESCFFLGVWRGGQKRGGGKDKERGAF